MIYYAGGNVGIGTSGPANTLHVVSSQAAMAQFQNTAGETRLVMNGASGWGGDLIFQANGVSQFGIYTVGGSNVGLGFFPNDGATAAMYITNGGSVGIGTTSPVHNLQVAGTIGAEEIIVSSTGADYVFKPDYRLRPLGELEAYVERNHHLPEIPAATDTANVGMGLGEMETKLLAKVEELTLYLIRSEKEHKALKERVAKLEAAPNRKALPKNVGR